MTTEATIGEVLSVAHIQLFSTFACDSLTYSGNTKIAFLLWIQLGLHTISIVARIIVMEVGSFGSKKWTFICNLTFLTITAT